MKFIWLFSLPIVFADRSVIIGDSLFCSHLSEKLELLAGHEIENNAIIGSSLENWWIPSIPTQYQELNKNPTINTLIMDGGGNDVIRRRNDCRYFNQECKNTIDKSLDIVEQLFQNAKQDNITDIIYLGFYYIQDLEQAVDYAVPKLKLKCENANVYYVDPRFALSSQMLSFDGVHPTDAGYDLLANMIWGLKLENNIYI